METRWYCWYKDRQGCFGTLRQPWWAIVGIDLSEAGFEGYLILQDLSGRHEDLERRFWTAMKHLEYEKILVSRELITRRYRLEFSVMTSMALRPWGHWTNARNTQYLWCEVRTREAFSEYGLSASAALLTLSGDLREHSKRRWHKAWGAHYHAHLHVVSQIQLRSKITPFPQELRTRWTLQIFVRLITVLQGQ